MNTTVTGVAHLWNDVLQAVLNKDTHPEQFQRIYIGGIGVSDVSQVRENSRESYLTTNKPNQKKEVSHYSLGGTFEGLYFTEREAQCMYLIIKNYTNEKVAERLGLSARTVEFYIKNMRIKTGCVSKSHLIKSILKTDFLENIDFSLEDL